MHLYIVYSETVDFNFCKFNLHSVCEIMDIIFGWNFSNLLCLSNLVALSGISAFLLREDVI